MKRLAVLTLCSVCLSAAICLLKKRAPDTIREGEGLVVPKAWLAPSRHPVTPAKDIRPADQTFLTFPEWFLVFSPEEQAAYYKHSTATTFPFMRHTAQIWESYKVVNDQIKGNFPSNTGYHFMIWVIGSSATVEYAVKAWYETVIGRLTDTGYPLTAEDKFDAAFTQDYVNFIKDRPWYEFDFKSRLNGLWAIVPLSGGHVARKWERRYILSSELLVKYLYGKLIGLGTKTVYEEALPETAVLTDPLPAGNTLFRTVKRYPDGSVLLYLPRYDRFNPAITALAATGCSIREIAGNKSAILVTLLVPAKNPVSFPDARTVFMQPITSDPAWQRMVIAVPVPRLSRVLQQAAGSGIKIEHVFDY